MATKTLYISILGLFLCLTSYSQTAELNEIDSILTNAYKSMEKQLPNFEIDTDRVGEIFKETLISQLKKQITFDNRLDSLSQYINIISSPDKKIKFYSWDKREGGTWHTMEVFAQFKSDNGRITIQSLVTSDTTHSVDYTDCLIYAVNEFAFDSTQYYLTFGWGTHGSGMQHKIVQIFSIQADSLIKCKSCFANNIDLIIEYPRVDTLKLSFNSKTNEITYHDVLSFEENRFYGRPTKNTVKLKLDNGKFRVK